MTSKEAQEYLKKNASTEERKAEENVRPLNDNFIVEPDMNTVLSQLIPKYLHLMLYTALLDSIASEHAARMVAMQTATDNADEILLLPTNCSILWAVASTTKTLCRNRMG